MDSIEKNVKKKNIIGVLFGVRCFVAFAVLCIFLFIPEKVDKLLLMEGRHPELIDLFGDCNIVKSVKRIDVLDELKECSCKEIDLLLPNILDYYLIENTEIDGINISVKDDYIELDGYAINDIWPNANSSLICLNSGKYYISAGFFHPDVYTYFSGWENNTCYQLSSGLGSTIITIEDEPFPQGYGIVMFIKQGALIHKSIVEPRISRIENLKVCEKKVFVIPINKKKWENLSVAEKKIIENTIEHYGNNTLWNSIMFDDNTGIQFVDGNRIVGSMNIFGDVY